MGAEKSKKKKSKKKTPKEMEKKITFKKDSILKKNGYYQEEYVEYGLDDIILDEEIKHGFKTIIHKMRKPDIFLPEEGSTILYHGPPGTGKTLLAKLTSKYVDHRRRVDNQCVQFHITCSDLQGVHVGETSEKIAKVFSELKNFSKNKGMTTIGIFDEFEVIGMAREFQNNYGGAIEGVNSLLTRMEYLNKFMHLIVIYNKQSLVDEALVDRFGDPFMFKLPDKKKIKKFLGMLFERYDPKSEMKIFEDDIYSESNLSKIASYMSKNQLSFRKIEHAIIKPLRRDIIYKRDIGKSSNISISLQDLEDRTREIVESTRIGPDFVPTYYV